MATLSARAESELRAALARATAAETQLTHAQEVITRQSASYAKVSAELKSTRADMRALNARVDALLKMIEAQSLEIQKLRADLALNASGGLTPSSRKPLGAKARETKVKPESSGRKPGGQEGHKGSTLNRRKPDEVIWHEPQEEVCECGSQVAAGKVISSNRRQSITASLQVRAIDHVALVRVCKCGLRHSGSFPQGVDAPVSYDASVKAIAVGIHIAGLLPLEASAQLLGGLFDLPISGATLTTWTQELSESLEGFDALSLRALLASGVVGLDESAVNLATKATLRLPAPGEAQEDTKTDGDEEETSVPSDAPEVSNAQEEAVQLDEDDAEVFTEDETGSIPVDVQEEIPESFLADRLVRVCRYRPWWIHVAVSDTVTRFHVSDPRQPEASRSGRTKDDIQACGILPNYEGTIVTDRLSSYASLHKGTHQICLNHVIKDLTSAYAYYIPRYKGDTGCDLPQLIQLFRTSIHEHTDLSTEVRELAEQFLLDIKLDTRKSMGKTKAILTYIFEHADLLFTFTRSEGVPPTNNFSERAIRPLKVKLNRSLTFRSYKGLKTHLALAGYMDTARKHGYTPIEALLLALDGKPVLPGQFRAAE